MPLYSFTRPNQMQGHLFSDDVAVTKALTRRGAMRKFGKLYADVKSCEVIRVSSLWSRVLVLTDY